MTSNIPFIPVNIMNQIARRLENKNLVKLRLTAKVYKNVGERLLTRKERVRIVGIMRRIYLYVEGKTYVPSGYVPDFDHDFALMVLHPFIQYYRNPSDARHNLSSGSILRIGTLHDITRPLMNNNNNGTDIYKNITHILIHKLTEKEFNLVYKSFRSYMEYKLHKRRIHRVVPSLHDITVALRKKQPRILPYWWKSVPIKYLRFKNTDVYLTRADRHLSPVHVTVPVSPVLNRPEFTEFKRRWDSPLLGHTAAKRRYLSAR